MYKILIAGGTGFLGQAIAGFLREQGYEVFLLSRNISRRSDFQKYTWDPSLHQLDHEILSDKQVIINLSGAGIGDKLWTKKRRKVLYDSRINSTRLLVHTIIKHNYAPHLYINASATGYYGNCGETVITEQTSVGQGFLSNLCADWENEIAPLKNTRTEIVILRIGIVLARDKGILPKLLLPLKLGINPIYGNGLQYMSWIFIEDLIRIVYDMISKKPEPGIYNCVSPKPVSQQSFNNIILQMLKKRALRIRIPEKLLRLLPGEMHSVITYSQRVRPEKLLSQHFQFSCENLSDALLKIFAG